MQSTELDARIKAGYSILKGKSPEIKVLVNDIIMANSDSQAKAIADSINRVHAVKPLTNNGTPLARADAPGPSQTIPTAKLNNIVEPNEEDTDTDEESLPVLDVSVEESTPSDTNDLDSRLKTMTVNTPKGNHANKTEDRRTSDRTRQDEDIHLSEPCPCVQVLSHRAMDKLTAVYDFVTNYACVI